MEIEISDPPSSDKFWDIGFGSVSILSRCTRKSAGKVVLFWQGFESGKRVFLLIATVVISGMSLKELGYPIK
jgi:hypothetical protein